MVNVSFANDAIGDLTISLAHHSAQEIQDVDSIDPKSSNLPIIFLNRYFPLL